MGNLDIHQTMLYLAEIAFLHALFMELQKLDPNTPNPKIKLKYDIKGDDEYAGINPLPIAHQYKFNNITAKEAASHLGEVLKVRADQLLPNDFKKLRNYSHIEYVGCRFHWNNSPECEDCIKGQQAYEASKPVKPLFEAVPPTGFELWCEQNGFDPDEQKAS